jgi:hypothetical protein
MNRATSTFRARKWTTISSISSAVGGASKPTAWHQKAMSGPGLLTTATPSILVASMS